MTGISVDCPNGHSLHVTHESLNYLTSLELRCPGLVESPEGRVPCSWGVMVMELHRKIDRGEKSCLMDRNHAQIGIGV